MLSDKLSNTALNLITKYGNTVTLVKEEQAGTYDPTTDTYPVVEKIIETKGVYRKPSFNDDKSVTNIVKVHFNPEIDLDYKLNGNKILKVVGIIVQDNPIAMDIYI